MQDPYGNCTGMAAKQKIVRQETLFALYPKHLDFYTVGASGLLINYLASLMFLDSTMNFWYIHATTIGIIISMSSNFILNKIWTFGDRSFEARKTVIQYGKFVGFSSLGGLVQLGMVFCIS